MRTRVKICGVTRAEDAKIAVAAGADALGLVFFEASPRCVNIKKAREIAASVSPFVTLVGLFVNATRDRIREVLDHVGLGLLQFHGEESADQCRGHGRAYIKAIRMRDNVDLHAAEQTYLDAAGLLLDSYDAHQPGGSGHTFQWDRIPRDLRKPVILAGGLTAENVGRAIARVRPYAVDVSSGVEQERGVKDADKITAFIRAVNRQGMN